MTQPNLAIPPGRRGALRAKLIAPPHDKMAPPKEPDMTEAIPTTWSDERDAAFFGITEKLAAGFADDNALLASVLAGDDLTEQIQKVLEDMIVAESWESMALRSMSHAESRDRDLFPVPVAARRRPV
jgi:hypothetical protein